MLLQLIYDLLIILTAGLLAGLICRKIGISVLVGYLIVGTLIGASSFGLITEKQHDIEYFVETGVFLLLFSIGLEFSLEELLSLGRNLAIGGSVQMILVAVPVAVVLMAADMDWQPALLIGAATSFSSTVLVFKSLSESGQSAVPLGRRAIGILLFQDAALIPLLLLVPLLTGSSTEATASVFLQTAITSLLFVGAVVVIRRFIASWAIPLLANHRSPDLVVLFTLVILGSVTLAAYSVQLPPAIGAFAAGLIFSGNRWTRQVDALILPLREVFAVIFFISLGLLADPSLLWKNPLLMFGGLAVLIGVKALAAFVALRLTRLSWKSSMGMGIGLAHVGEFAFVLVLLGLEAGVVTDQQYVQLVTLALGSLILTPLLLRLGMRWLQDPTDLSEYASADQSLQEIGQQAIVIGAGPTGRQVASRIEMTGYDVCVVDLSPINLHPFSQQGFRTIAGDATQPDILDHAHLSDAAMVVVCVPNDEDAISITKNARKKNPHCLLFVRCRYQVTVTRLATLGANGIVSEEAQASEALVKKIIRSFPPKA